MKKKFAAFLGIMVFVMSGCRSVPDIQNTSVVQLKGNPTTGYTWTAESFPPDIVEITQEFVQGGKPGMTGAPGVFYFTVTAVNPGNGMIVFEYRRPWEKKEPEEKHCYTVTVTSEGGLILVEQTDEDNE